MPSPIPSGDRRSGSAARQRVRLREGSIGRRGQVDLGPERRTCALGASEAKAVGQELDRIAAGRWIVPPPGR